MSSEQISKRGRGGGILKKDEGGAVRDEYFAREASAERLIRFALYYCGPRYCAGNLASDDFDGCASYHNLTILALLVGGEAII